MGNKILPFFGAACAIVTPFDCQGNVDYSALERIIEFQISRGSDGIVVLGTTGEASSLTAAERSEVISFTVSHVRHRVPVIVGVGTNVTSTTVNNCREACRLGADGLLVITPYYSKASAEGLYLHFKAAAESVDLPIILYTVPSRTGMGIPFEVYKRLAEVKNICAVKEASGNIGNVLDISENFGDSLFVYSGNDDLTLPIIACGGVGVISVASNIAPREMHELARAAVNGDFSVARKLQLKLNPLIRSLFSEVNPIPVKCACSLLGLCRETMRLPLCPLDEAKRDALENEMTKLDLF